MGLVYIRDDITIKVTERKVGRRVLLYLLKEVNFKITPFKKSQENWDFLKIFKKGLMGGKVKLEGN